MKLGIVGCRDRNEERHFELVCNKVLEIGVENIEEIVSGGCKKGGDRFAEIIAETLHIPVKRFLPECPPNSEPWIWFQAAMARNTQIADYSDKLIALVHPKRSGGTEDTITKFLLKHPKENLYIL